jgi:hypothetical protein
MFSKNKSGPSRLALSSVERVTVWLAVLNLQYSRPFGCFHGKTVIETDLYLTTSLTGW